MIQSEDDIEDTYIQMQLSISEWGDLIRITGGCMEPDKIAWYLVDYEWRKGNGNAKTQSRKNFWEPLINQGQLFPPIPSVK